MGNIADKLTAAIASREAIRVKFSLPEDLPFSEYAANINISVGPGDGLDTTTSNPPTAAQIVAGKEAWANGSKIVGTAATVTPAFNSSTGKFTVDVGFVSSAYSKSLGTITSSNTTVADDTVTIPAGYNKTKFTKTVAAATVTETDDSITISKGWLSSAITRSLGISTDSENPAIPELVYEGYEFFVNGERYEGTMPNADIIIEGMDGGGHNVRVTPGYVSEEFEQFVYDRINLGFITATAEDIRLGKIGADEHGGMIEGTLVVPEGADVSYGYVDDNGKFQELDLSGESPITVGDPIDFSAILYKTGVEEPVYNEGNTDTGCSGEYSVVKLITVEPIAVEAVAFSARSSSSSSIPLRIVVGGLPDSHPANGVYELYGELDQGDDITNYSYHHVATEGEYQIIYSNGAGIVMEWGDEEYWAIFNMYEQSMVAHNRSDNTRHSLLGAAAWIDPWDEEKNIAIWEEGTKIFNNIIVSDFPSNMEANGEYTWITDSNSYFGGYYKARIAVANNKFVYKFIVFQDMMGDGGTWYLVNDISFNEDPLAWLASTPSRRPLVEPEGEQRWIDVNEDSFNATFTVQRDSSSGSGSDTDNPGNNQGGSGSSAVPTRLTIAGIPDANPANGDYEVTAETANADTLEGRVYKQVTGDLYESGYRAIKYYGGPEDEPWGENRWAVVLVESDQETGDTYESLIFFKEETPNALIGAYNWTDFEYGESGLFSVYPAGTSLFKSITISGFPSDDGMGRDLTAANGTYNWIEASWIDLGGYYKHPTEDYYIYYYDITGGGGCWWLNSEPSNPEGGAIAYSEGVPSEPVAEPSGELGWYNDELFDEFAYVTTVSVSSESPEEPETPEEPEIPEEPEEPSSFYVVAAKATGYSEGGWTFGDETKEYQLSVTDLAVGDIYIADNSSLVYKLN